MSVRTVFSVPLTTLMGSTIPASFVFIVTRTGQFAPLTVPIVRPMFATPDSTSGHPGLLRGLSVTLLTIFTYTPVLVSELSVFTGRFAGFHVGGSNGRGDCHLCVFPVYCIGVDFRYLRFRGGYFSLLFGFLF